MSHSYRDDTTRVHLMGLGDRVNTAILPATEPMPVALIAAITYDPEVVWAAHPIGAHSGAISLIANAVAARPDRARSCTLRAPPLAPRPHRR